MTIVTTSPEIDRDRYGRPMVMPPNGGKRVAYTRCTTFIDVLDDRFNLEQWKQRMVATGLAQRPDLLLGVQAHLDDKRELNKLCDSAREAAASSAAATTGTALHALTELIDRGQELPVIPTESKADLDAYRAATAGLKATHIERFAVMDRLKVGGTPDRIVKYGGESYIADIKTGSIEWGTLKIAMQLAIYSRSSLYDIATGARTVHGASTNRGIIIHLPAGQAKAELHWIDLEAGWHAVQVAKDVREKRKLKFKELTEPFGKPDRDSLHLQKRDAAKAEDRAGSSLEQQINACETPDEVRQLWADNAKGWTETLTAAAKRRIAGLAS